MTHEKLHGARSFHISIIVSTALVLLTACGQRSAGDNNRQNLQTTQSGSTGSPSGQSQSQSQSMVGSVEQSEILQAQANQARKAELTVRARVRKMLPADTEGLPHERFLIELNNGSTVLVAHDTAMAPVVPLHAGDFVRIHGEYIWNPKGGVLHWTHHTDSPRHDGGWIDFNGQRYQ